jgi:CheY-like chemotaxis protein
LIAISVNIASNTFKLHRVSASSLLYEQSEEGRFMRVLVVDDDEIFCRFLVEVLEEVGIVAASVTDGFAAFDLVNRVAYDVCIIDVRMPLILGTELAEAITELHPRTKFILASALPTGYSGNMRCAKGCYCCQNHLLDCSCSMRLSSPPVSRSAETNIPDAARD